VKTKEEAKANLAASVSYIPDRYRNGIQRADWATAAGSDQAEKNFADAMGQAIAAKRRQAKVKQVSNTDWQAAAAGKGADVIGTRIRDSIEKQSARWAPIYDRVQADIARLPARTVDFRSNVQNRVIGTVEAWKKHSGKL